MLYAPTHVVDVLTGTTDDEYGDPVAGTTVAAANIPAAILESSARVSRLDTDTPRTVTILKGRLPSGTPVNDGDRLRDTLTGQLWLIDSASHNANPVIDADITLDLRRLP